MATYTRAPICTPFVNTAWATPHCSLVPHPCHRPAIFPPVAKRRLNLRIQPCHLTTNKVRLRIFPHTPELVATATGLPSPKMRREGCDCGQKVHKAFLKKKKKKKKKI